MPIYEYQCQQCAHQCEFLQKFSDEPKTHCPNCNNETLKKKISAAGFQLKGSGWYVTDFRGDNRKQPNEKNDKSEAKTTTTSEKKAEKKTETSSE